MNKFLLKALILATVNIAILSSAQFRTKNRQSNLESFDEQKYSWGFYLSGNLFDYHVVLDPRFGKDGNKSLVTTKGDYGFGAGLIGKFKINDSFDFRLEPGLQFSERNITFDTQSNDQYYEGTLNNPPFTPILLSATQINRTIKSTYIDIPMMVEYHGNRWYNSRPYIAAGFNYIVNLQSNSDSEDDNQQEVFRSTTHNFAYSGEIGIQLYFGRFRLTPAVRGTFFMNNEIKADNIETPPYWSAAVATAQSRAIMFVLKFE